MKEAKIFGEQSNRLVKAIDIKMGKESKDHQFVDPEYEFKVTYVKGAKNNGVPHFRLYLSHDDYLKLTPERKTKFDILKGMNKQKNIKEPMYIMKKLIWLLNFNTLIFQMILLLEIIFIPF